MFGLTCSNEFYTISPEKHTKEVNSGDFMLTSCNGCLREHIRLLLLFFRIMHSHIYTILPSHSMYAVHSNVHCAGIIFNILDQMANRYDTYTKSELLNFKDNWNNSAITLFNIKKCRQYIVYTSQCSV